MIKIFLFFITTVALLAGEVRNPTFLSNLMGSLIPIIVFFTIFIFLTKKINKNNGLKEATNSNIKLAESNLNIASELKRIADILEKKEKN